MAQVRCTLCAARGQLPLGPAHAIIHLQDWSHLNCQRIGGWYGQKGFAGILGAVL
jgi:hypothetical protein